VESSKRGLCIVFAFLTAGVVIFGGSSRKADAVPVFSRKYHTSCMTCHVIFPKLNPFGEAFRLNGYRMPGETEEQVKQVPVSLGAEAYAKLWPKMVYPSTLPGNVPLAINVKMADLYASAEDDEGKQIIHNDFQFPQEANLFAAGTLGNHMGFFGELTYGELPDGSTEVEIEHARLDFVNAFGPEHLFNFRVGKLAPNAWDHFQEMWLMTDSGIDTFFEYNPIGFYGGTGLCEEEDCGISLPSNARAIEMYGIVAHRLLYVIGVDSPIGPGGPYGAYGSTTQKDVYGRVDYKIGGLALDGTTSPDEKLPPENWRETSFRLGFFGYGGNGDGVLYPVTDAAGEPFDEQDASFQRFGAYGSLYFGDLNLFGGYVHGKDNLQIFEPGSTVLYSSTSPTWNAWFVQADYVIVPPFQLSMRYQQLSPGDPAAPLTKLLTANVSFLAYANVKLMVEYNGDLQNSNNYSISTVLRAAF
jgi:hypothetical protein